MSVYPLRYTRQLQDFDNWDHFVSVRVLGRLTVHDFPDPPKSVLDLGCGTGLWVVDAAKTWKKSSFVGFDIRNIQPDLFRSGFPDLAGRVQWAHGNFLEPLPFPSHYFDFVRIRNIGLGVPEDKWQSLLEDVSRVLKPGGLLEIMEEDLIFPCGPFPRLPTSSSSLMLPKQTSSSRFSTHSNISADTISPIPLPRDNLLIDRSNSQDLDHPASPECPRKSLDYTVDPRDHRRMLASWKNMLHNRFLAPKLLSILPFYLSLAFTNVQPHPLLQIKLPPNSALAEKEPEDCNSMFEHDSGISFHMHLPATAVKEFNYLSNVSLPDSAGPLQLARSFHTVMACKEALWVEYEALYSNSPTVSQVLGRDANTARDEFEFHWSNWVDDMTDRISMRSVMSASLSWPIPPSGTPPSQQWRDRCGKIYADDSDEHVNSNEFDLCRSLRCFLAWNS